MSRLPRSRAQSPAVYQRKSDRSWYYKTKNPAGLWRDRRVPNSTEMTEREAIAAAKLLIATKVEPVIEGELTIAAFAKTVQDRQADQPTLRDSTRKNRAGHLANHVLPRIGSMPLASFKVSQARALAIDLRDNGRTMPRSGDPKRTTPRPLSSHTLRNILQSASDLFEEALADDLVAANPFRADAVRKHLPPPERIAGEHVAICVSRADAEALVGCQRVAEGRRVVHTVALLTGLRAGELGGLRWSNVVLDHEVPHIRVERSLNEKGVLGPLKHRNARRPVPLHPVAAETLRRWKLGAWVLLTGHAARDSDHVFVDLEGNLALRPHADHLRADLARAGRSTTFEGHPITYHATRRSFATWLYEAGVPDVARRRLMGHGKADVTDGYTAKNLAPLAAGVLAIPFDADPTDIASTEPVVTHDGALITARSTARRSKGRTAERRTPNGSAAPPAGIEPATFGLGNRCSIH